MLKIIKYDIRSVIIFPIFILIVMLVFFFWGIDIIHDDFHGEHISMTSNAIISMLPAINILLYLVCYVIVIGVLGRKCLTDIELYEMAGVSPIKVSLARMLTVFSVMAIIAYYLTLLETLMVSYEVKLYDVNPIQYLYFSIYGEGLISLLKPLFMGLFATVVFSTSLLFATISRRIERDIVKVCLLGVIIIIAIFLHFIIVYHIDFVMARFNLNNYGAYGAILPTEAFRIEFIHFIRPNYLNIGLIIYHALFVAVMLSFYSVRRRLI